jgi:hypothetical protein
MRPLRCGDLTTKAMSSGLWLHPMHPMHPMHPIPLTLPLRVLLEHDADVTGRHPDGRSLVQLARDQGSEEIVNLPQEHGVNV